jgi:hypothetical protein
MKKSKNKISIMTKKKIIILFAVIIVLFFSWTGFFWKIFSCGIAGSYPCAETWSLNVSEKELIKIIEDIKKEHPELDPPNISYPSSNKNEYWYDFSFYYQDTKENVYTWIRQNSDSSTTTIALVAIASHIDSQTPSINIKNDRREINRDFNYFANKKEISKFKKQILNLIIQKINNKKI